jgi:hypothetical protein
MKTTSPHRYLVKPTQGIIPPGGKLLVTLSVNKRHKLELWQEISTAYRNNLGCFSSDKFQIKMGKLSLQQQNYLCGLSGSKEGYEVIWNQLSSDDMGVYKLRTRFLSLPPLPPPDLPSSSSCVIPAAVEVFDVSSQKVCEKVLIEFWCV